MSRPRDRLVRAGYRLGWAAAARVPPAAARVVIGGASRLVLAADGRHVQNLRTNVGVAAGRPADAGLMRAAVASYLRMQYEVLSLPRWPADRVVSSVSIENSPALEQAVNGPGAVVALPHSGNWDLAGAWACRSGMPVTTVAEQLADPDFAAFLAFREGLGMEVISHRDPDAVARLVRAIHRRRVVCLIADRDLSGAGVPVRWAGQVVRMPAGPAVVARRSGAALLPAVSRYTADGMVIAIGGPVAAASGRTGLVQMTQGVADFFAAKIAEAPADWHMLQPFFTAGEAA